MAAARVVFDSRYLVAEKEDGVPTVTIDRPERRNALTIEMYHGLKKAAVLTERDPEIDVLVVTGRGEYFCVGGLLEAVVQDRKSTRLNSSHGSISYAVFCLKKKKQQ